ncbi:hypothetical protein I3760_09G013400 [Carya illinoinensis]|nr:hypothetical protein I3760_09G013400 [Carya illinoinensis]
MSYRDHTPKLGLEFNSEQEAYDFYNEEWYNKRKVDGLVTSRKFVCCKEGLQAKCERDRQKRYEQAETRIDCKAHMIIRHDKEKQKYCIHSIKLNHNHALHIPQSQALEIDLADDSGIQLKDSYEFMGRQVGGKDALGYTKQDQKNYLHNKRQRELKYGEAGNTAKQITNIFWADAQMIVDYNLLGDYRPLAMFVGFNHHRETTIFESFKWLFETFFEAMSDPAIAKAISMWHLMQNAMKHVGHLLRGESGFRIDFSACFKIYEEEEVLFSAWDSMLHKYNVCDNSWLQHLFELKEKWAKAYVKMSFSARMTSTQLSESLNSDLKDYLQSNYDIVKLFTHFERLIDAKRYKELQAEYNLRQKLPRVKIASPMLMQAANTYTSQLFLKFQKQYEEDLSHEYVVSIYGKPKNHKVIWNSLENNVSCSCRKFERWTKEAKNESVQDFNGNDIITDTNLELISRAVEYEEAYMLALGNYKELSGKIEDIFRKKFDICQIEDSQQYSLEDITTSSVKGLKKKQGCKGRCRYKSCLEMKISVHFMLKEKEEVATTNLNKKINIYKSIQKLLRDG